MPIAPNSSHSTNKLITPDIPISLSSKDMKLTVSEPTKSPFLILDPSCPDMITVVIDLVANFLTCPVLGYTNLSNSSE